MVEEREKGRGEKCLFGRKSVELSVEKEPERERSIRVVTEHI